MDRDAISDLGDDGLADHSNNPSLSRTASNLFSAVNVSSLLAVAWDQFTDNLELISHRIWQLTPTEPLDIEATIEWYLRQLYSGVTRITNPQ